MYKDPDWITKRLKNYNIEGFYYFSRIENFLSIINNGILSRNYIQSHGIHGASFAIEDVQNRRHIKSIKLTDGKIYNIHDLVPTYFVSKTPTLYARREMQDEIFFCIIDSTILAFPDIHYGFSDGNVACQATKCFYSLSRLYEVNWELIYSQNWCTFSDGKRQRCAEMLIYPSIPSKFIKKIVVRKESLATELKDILNNLAVYIEVEINPSLFF